MFRSLVYGLNYRCEYLFQIHKFGVFRSARFGLYQVNFTDPARTRTPKASVAFFQQVAKTRRIPEAKTDK